MSDEHRELFCGYPRSTRMFYNRLFYKLMLNAVAVKRGLFDELLCSSDDPLVFVRFGEQIDDLRVKLLGESNQKAGE